MRNYYKVLGITETASRDEIREAYRKLVKQWHPDRNPNDPMLQEMMKLFNEAYEVLSDTNKRNEHDALLGLRPDHINQQIYRDDRYQNQNADLAHEYSTNKTVENVASYGSWEYEQASFPSSCNIWFGSLCVLIGIISLIQYGLLVHHIRSAINWPTVEGQIPRFQHLYEFRQA